MLGIHILTFEKQICDGVAVHVGLTDKEVANQLACCGDLSRLLGLFEHLAERSRLLDIPVSTPYTRALRLLGDDLRAACAKARVTADQRL